MRGRRNTPQFFRNFSLSASAIFLLTPEKHRYNDAAMNTDSAMTATILSHAAPGVAVGSVRARGLWWRGFLFAAVSHV
jgi:hypothetical protein